MKRIVEMCNSSERNTDRIILENSGEIRPNDCAPALVALENKICAAAMRWGFARDDGKLIINARSESIAERATFRRLAEKNRCALPAAGYFEWRDSDRLKHMIAPSGAEGFYLAGLYQADAQGRLRFVVLTRDAYGEHARIHNRMPLLLTTREQVRQWLSGALSVDALVGRSPENLSIQTMGVEQLSMDFDDHSDA